MKRSTLIATIAVALAKTSVQERRLAVAVEEWLSENKWAGKIVDRNKWDFNRLFIDIRKIFRNHRASSPMKNQRSYEQKRQDIEELIKAINELLCWLPGQGTAAERGAKCETQYDAIQQARSAIRMARDELT